MTKLGQITEYSLGRNREDKMIFFLSLRESLEIISIRSVTKMIGEYKKNPQKQNSVGLAGRGEC